MNNKDKNKGLCKNGLKVLSLCGGVETGLYALQQLGIPISEYHTYEILPEAIAVSTYHFPWIVHHGDLYDADFEQFKDFDLLLAGTCCFASNELVLTSDGYKKISDIKIGDYVRTHKNRYKKVLNIFDNGTKETIELYTMQSSKIECTLDHKFYVRKMERKWDSSIKHKRRFFSNPEWKMVNELDNNYYVGTPINLIEEIPSYNGIDIKRNKYKTIHINELSEKFYKPAFWKMVGRFIGDGWVSEYTTRRENGNLRNIKRTIICCSHEEKQELSKIINEAEFTYSVSKHRTTYEFQITNLELTKYLLGFGKGASNKHLTRDVLNLPCNLLKSFLDGYISADGCYLKDKNIFQYTTTSKQLAYDIAMCWNKVYKLHTSITLSKRTAKYMIENRTVNQKNNYIVRCPLQHNKQDKAFYENGYIWSPFRRIESHNKLQKVYDIEVEEDHSYIVNNIIVHNCQSLSRIRAEDESVSNGLNGKSKIFYKAVEALQVVRPKYFMFENVIPNKKEDLDEMTRLIGVEPHLIDAGIFSAQNRERYYWTNIPLGKLPAESPLVFKDVMESDVGEKYYYDKKFKILDMSKRTCAELLVNTTEMCRRIYNPNFKMVTLTCVSGGYQCKAILIDGIVRKLTEIEYERLQGLPDNYTNVLVNGKKLSYSKRCSLMGNGWNEPTVEWILSGLKDLINEK